MTRIIAFSLILMLVSCADKQRKTDVSESTIEQKNDTGNASDSSKTKEDNETSKNNNTLSGFFESLPVIEPPFEYSYDFITDLPGTKALKRSELQYISSFVSSDTDLSDCHAARLPSRGGYHFVLIFANNSIGEGQFFLCALNDKYKLTDSLLIYDAHDMEWKDQVENAYLHYLVGGNGHISIREVVTTNGGVDVLNSKSYKFVKGKFKKIKQ